MQVKRVTLLIFLLQSILAQTFCQPTQEEDLKKYELMLRNQKHDKAYVDLLNMVARASYSTHPEKTKMYSQQALALADSLKYIKGLADSYSSSSLIYKLKAEYGSELSLHMEALKIYLSLKDSISIAQTYNAIGVVHYQLKDYTSSSAFHEKALQIFYLTHDEKGVAETLLKKGNVFMELGKSRQGISAYEQVLTIERSLKNDLGISNALNNLGVAYYELKNYNKALEYYRESKNLIIKINNLNRLPASYHNIAQVYLEQGKTDSAMNLAIKDLLLSKRLGIRPAFLEATKLLSDIYRKKQEPGMAMLYLERYYEIKDSIESTENTLRVARLQSIYRLEEKDKEIDLLKKDKEITALTQRATTYAFVGILIIVGLIIYDQRVRIKKNHEIIKKNDELHKTQATLTEIEIKNKQLVEKELRQDLEFRQKELLIFTLNLVQKNTLMEEMRGGIEEVLSSTDKDSKIKLNRLIKLIDYSLETEKDWDEFKMHFEKVHSSFFENLKSAYPDLGQGDLKLCALISLNLSMKEMAELLGISSESVKMARHRLRKKLNLETETNLNDFLNNFKEVDDQGIRSV